MVYSFRKRKLKRAWGNSNANDNSGNNNGNSNGNVQYNFNDLESAARLSSRFLGRPAPDLNDLATQFLKQSEVESDVEEGEDVEDVDNNIDNILRTTEADDDNNSSGHKILSNIHDSQYQQKVTEDDEFEGTDLKKAKVFFSKLKDFYKENYDRVVLVFIDSLQVQSSSLIINPL